MAVKEEPRDEDPPGATKPARGPPGFPRDIPVAELLQRLSLAAEDELLFLQLPDTLPGQPPTQDTKPVKTELQTEEGQVVVVKQEKSQVIGARGGFLGWFCGFCCDFCGFWGGFGGAARCWRFSVAGGEAGGEHVHPGRPPRGAGGEAAGPQVGEGAAGAGQGDLGRDHGDPLLLPAGTGGAPGMGFVGLRLKGHLGDPAGAFPHPTTGQRSPPPRPLFQPQT